MNDKKVFLDSNILVYLIDKDQVKKEKALALVHASNLISTQVVAENINAGIKKLKLTKEETFIHARGLLNNFNLVLLHPSTFELAMMICIKYQLRYYDSLIVAAALENDCETLYSEDMQDGLVIESKLTIVNPFK
jgi:predicted nucleic acid-binding protein